MQVGDRVREVVLDGGTATVDGVAMAARLEAVPGTSDWVLVIGDAVHRVTARREAARGAWTVQVDGWTVEAEALDERQRAIKALQGASTPSGPAPVVAPMPGLIVRVAVAPGDEVAAGQGVVVMEAMKMENELKAAAAGRVRAVHAVPGTAVERGQVLVELE